MQADWDRWSEMSLSMQVRLYMVIFDAVANQVKSGSTVPHGSEAVAQEPCNTAMFITPDGILCGGYQWNHN